MAKAKVYLAVGHGLRDDGIFDPGAVGGGWSEQTAGDPIVATAASELRRWGFNVMHEAHRNDPNFRGTVRAANAWGADVLVSVHHDWTGAPPGAFGHWVSPAGKQVADAVYDAVQAAGFPMRPRWHKYRTDLYVLNRSDMPAMLWECGRIGDLNTKPVQEKMGRAIAEGIASHFGTIPTPPPPPIEDPSMPLSDDDVDRIAQAVATTLGWQDHARTSSPLRDYNNDIGRIRRTLRKMAQHLHLPDEDIEV